MDIKHDPQQNLFSIEGMTYEQMSDLLRGLHASHEDMNKSTFLTKLCSELHSKLVPGMRLPYYEWW